MAFHRIYHHALNPENIIFLNAPTEAGDWPPIKVLHWLGVAPLFTEVGNADLDYAARFTSPEQLYTGRVDLRSETYALGCTMWFLLTGAPPIAPEPGIGFSVKSASELDFVPKIVRHLILRMLHPEPDERPQDPVALNAILQTCLARVERKVSRIATIEAIRLVLLLGSAWWLLGEFGLSGIGIAYLATQFVVAVVLVPGIVRITRGPVPAP